MIHPDDLSAQQLDMLARKAFEAFYPDPAGRTGYDHLPESTRVQIRERTRPVLLAMASIRPEHESHEAEASEGAVRLAVRLLNADEAGEKLTMLEAHIAGEGLVWGLGSANSLPGTNPKNRGPLLRALADMLEAPKQKKAENVATTPPEAPAELVDGPHA